MEKEIVLQKLNLFIDQAAKEKKWIFNRYMGKWFLPEDLRLENGAGRKIWLPIEFELRNPIERFRELKAEAENATRELQNFADKLFSNPDSFNACEPTIGKEFAEFWNQIIEERYSGLKENEKTEQKKD